MTNGYPTGRHARGGAIPWLFGGALIVVAVFGIALAVLLTGNSTPSGSGHHKQQALAAASPGVTAPAQSVSPSPAASSHKPTAKNSHSAPAPPPSSTPPPSPLPKPTHQAKPKPAGTARLAASVSANAWGSTSSGGRVAFQVNDTGSAATGTVSVSITLPAGASMTNGGGPGPEAVLTPFDGGGWNCQPTSTGAICTHAGLGAGNQAWGEVFFTVSGGTACGQPVDLTAASGSVSASANATVSC